MPMLAVVTPSTTFVAKRIEKSGVSENSRVKRSFGSTARLNSQEKLIEAYSRLYEYVMLPGLRILIELAAATRGGGGGGGGGGGKLATADGGGGGGGGGGNI